jgi:FkbM family methyltransferase
MNKALFKRALERFGYTIQRTQPNYLTGSNLKGDLRIMLRDHPKPICFDVGANKGQTIDFLLDAFPKATIAAFEPNEKLFVELQRRYSAEPCVRLIRTALGEAAALKEFRIYEADTLSSFLELDCNQQNPFGATPQVGSATVQVSTIDDYCAMNNIKTIDILKIDTQGFDLHVLKGAEGMLAKKAIHLVYVEVNFVHMYVDQPSFDSIFTFLDRFNYGVLDFYEKARKGSAINWCNVCFVNSDLPYRPG